MFKCFPSHGEYTVADVIIKIYLCCVHSSRCSGCFDKNEVNDEFSLYVSNLMFTVAVPCVENRSDPSRNSDNGVA